MYNYEKLTISTGRRGYLEIINTLLLLSGTIGGIFIVYSFIPQIELLVRTKDSKGHSIAFWTIISLGITLAAISMIGMNIVQGTATKPLGIINEVTQFFNATFAITVLVLVKKYSK